MKRLLILLLAILISFNSYGSWLDITVCVKTDAQDKDGIIYLLNKTKPFSGKNLCLIDFIHTSYTLSKSVVGVGVVERLLTEQQSPLLVELVDH